jgi:hypothetical protein
VNTITGTGLCYKCNEFYDNGSDLAVVDTEKELPIGIKTYQGAYGNDSTPAGNIFSQQSNSFHINNRAADVEMKYLYHGKSNTVPLFWLIPLSIDNVYPIGVPGVYYDKSKSCVTWIGKPVDPEEKMLSDYNTSVEAENQVRESIFTLQDGGSTEETLIDISTSGPQDSYILSQDLLNISPYLSDTTLNEIAEDEFVLDNSLVRDILVSNPHAGKSSKILSKIENRFNPMPDEMFLEILESSENIGPYEQLLESFENYNSIRYKKFDELVDFYTSDYENPNSLQKLINLVNSDNSIYADLVLIKHFVAKGFLNEATSRVNSLNSRFSTFENITLLQGQIGEFLTIHALLSDTIGIDSTNMASLQSIALNGEYPVNTWASNLISFIDGTSTLETYVLPTPGELRSTRVRPISSKRNYSGALTIYPNPAKDYFIATYNTSNEATNKKIVVRSLDGKIMLESNVVGSNNSKTIYLERLTTGTYIVELIGNNYSIATAKLQVIR